MRSTLETALVLGAEPLPDHQAQTVVTMRPALDRLLPRLNARVRLAAAGSLLVLAACDDTTLPPSPVFGSIHLAAVTTGLDLDDDGYLVDVDLGVTVVLPANGEVAFTDLAPGSHNLRISGIATNCTVGGGVNQQITVTAGEVTTVRLTITCVTRFNPIPAGTLEVRTNTAGIELDPNGYSVLVSNLSTGSANSLFLPINGIVQVELVPDASYLVVLSGVAPNCHVVDDGSLTRTASIAARERVTVTFAIFCQPAYPARLPAGSQLAFVRDGKIHLVNSDGTGVVKLTDGPNDCDPSWSPDGERIAFVRNCGEISSAIYLVNGDGSNLVRRTQGVYIRNPSWSPNGSRIAFSKLIVGSVGVVTISAADDGIQAVVVLDRPGYDAEPSWSPDGKSIAFVSDWAAYDFVYDIYVAPSGGGTIAQLTDGFNIWPNLLQYYEPAWSPDGTRLAMTRCPAAFYTCDVSDVVIMNADGSGVTELAATRGYANPTWSTDGTVLAFSSGGMLSWVRPATKERGFIVDQGHSPAWRPATATRFVK
jgi:WD40 repeat protein